ncbi:Tvp15p Ecym_3512 [Eremothecium cymbalariae DBVPG|uniref:Golgi apparatus membrane protein TVP15 n=1 Tax=Eremothecium cymbalariae (strain CBS 270.75 / DBVPG 7215 / KCTC 17166 / NRRL Y-17582) TaxID=931890 RepID=G8JS71_ERECY|nr:Hypothetical protein Ecym_3512 [Eremothecium cymbalariae DBVPG\
MAEQETILQRIFLTNVVIGSVSVLVFLGQLSYIFTNFAAFIRSIFGVTLSIPLVYLEFKPLPWLSRFASFYYSYLGRGLLLVLLSTMIVTEGFLAVFSVYFLFIAGVVFIVCEYNSGVIEPPSFRDEGASLTVGDDDDDVI